jgi:endonuclease-3 related protein
VRKTPEDRIIAIYRTLIGLWGPQHWWPAESPLEVILGAILVQNTAWTNAARAIEGMRAGGVLSMEGIRRTPLPEIEQIVRSSGYFRQKAARIKRFVEWMDERYGGSLERMFRRPAEQLRGELLALPGIGRETADTILLYAGQHEIFVVDAYTRRIFERHELIAPKASYEEVRELVELELRHPVHRVGSEPDEHAPLKHQPSAMSEQSRSSQAQAFNEMHALLVQVGKEYCHRSRALCERCPLKYDLPQKGVTLESSVKITSK